MRRPIAALVVLAWIGLTSAAGAQSMIDVDLERYRQATGTASVVTRAFQEGRRSSASDAPLADITLLLLPRSERLLARLTGVRAAARDSLARYRGAITELRSGQEEFIKALIEAGAETLIRRGRTDGSGTAVLVDVPPGVWMLLAWRSQLVDKPSSHSGQREQRIFTPPPAITGYREITIWLRELKLERDGREAIELTDRNVWWSGIEEVARTGTGR
jgi:hypothetical protein